MQKFIHHLCIQTNHYQASLTFYELLGFIKVKETTDFHGRDYNTWLQLGESYIELQTGKKELGTYQKEAEGIPHFCLYTDELDQLLEELVAANVPFLEKHGGKIYTVENGRLFKVKAPEGTIVEFRDTIII